MTTFLVVLAVILLLLILSLFTLYTKDIASNDAPIIFSGRKSLQKFFRHYSFPKGSIFLDIGSGDGRVLQCFYKNNREGSAIGIEKALFPYLLSKILLCKTEVSLYHMDIFDKKSKEVLKRASHIFAYLYPKMLERLSPLLKERLDEGVTIFCLDFPLPGVEASQVIFLQKEEGCIFHEFGRKVYVYKKT
jgi:hypothetical protein